MLIPSVLTHGTLDRRLRGALERYGGERTALAVEWAREEFPLPAQGRGEPISQEKLEELLRRLEPAVFFDSPRSIREKLGLAKGLGAGAALLPGPEVEERLEEIFGPEGS